MLVMEGAGWHGSSALRIPDTITIVTLPPYAPELNPVENIWAVPSDATVLSHSSAQIAGDVR